MHHILWLFLNKNRNRTETKTWYVKRVCGKKSARALTHTRKLNDANLWRSFSWSFYCRPNTKNGLNVSLILFPIRILCCACVCVGKELNFFTFYLSNINKWNRWKRGSEFNSSQTKPKYCSFYFSLVWLPPFLPANSLYISFARNVSNSLNHKGSSHLAWKRFSFMMQILCCVKSSALSLCWMDRRGGGGGSFKAITKFHWIKPSSEWVKYSH